MEAGSCFRGERPEFRSRNLAQGPAKRLGVVVASVIPGMGKQRPMPAPTSSERPSKITNWATKKMTYTVVLCLYKHVHGCRYIHTYAHPR